MHIILLKKLRCCSNDNNLIKSGSLFCFPIENKTMYGHQSHTRNHVDGIKVTTIEEEKQRKFNMSTTNSNNNEQQLETLEVESWQAFARYWVKIWMDKATLKSSISNLVSYHLFFKSNISIKRGSTSLGLTSMYTRTCFSFRMCNSETLPINLRNMERAWQLPTTDSK